MTSATPIRVMTVDDHEVMRGGLRFMLLAFDDIELVAEARSGEEALRLCREAPPDVVLMDLKMPQLDGVATTKALKMASPDVQVVILTSFHDHGLVERALRAGAIGYLLKDVTKEDLATAIRAARTGNSTLAPEATRDLVSPNGFQPAIGHDLSEREREVLSLVVRGYSNRQIAKRLFRSPHTIRNHVSQIMAKLGAANRAEAAALAVRHGILD